MNERIYPSKPLLGVGAVVLINDKILLVKRGSPPGKLKWSVPGGLVEVGESILDAVKRELMEETGLEGEPQKLLNIAEVIISDNSGTIKYHYVILDFEVKLKNVSKPKPSSDVIEAVFKSIEEALSMDLTAPTRDLLIKLKNGDLEPCSVRTLFFNE